MYVNYDARGELVLYGNFLVDHFETIMTQNVEQFFKPELSTPELERIYEKMAYEKIMEYIVLFSMIDTVEVHKVLSQYAEKRGFDIPDHSDMIFLRALSKKDKLKFLGYE